MRWPIVPIAVLLAALVPARPVAAAAPSPHDIVTTEADIAAAMYGDARAAGETLRQRVEAFLAAPNATTLDAARAAWIAARRPHAMAASLRFVSPLTAAWERRVDAWPITPGLIDYAAGAGSRENPLAKADVIQHTEVRIGGRIIPAGTIDGRLLAQLQDADGIPTNVAAGYHVVEFLLWGEDGARPASDYAAAGCTHGPACARRRAYLKLVTELLVADLGRIAADWAPGGGARAAFLAEPPADALAAILTAFGDQSFQGLAGERMKLSLVLHDATAAEDRFSGAAAADYVAAEHGLAALFRGHYRSAGGDIVAGPGLAALAAERAPDAATAVEAAMMAAAERLDAIAEAATAAGGYRRLIASGNAAGNRLVMDGVHALVRQAQAGERLARALGVATSVEGGERLAGPPPGRR
jgi:putative iron-regulated protein